jgi:hypothetical protein
MPEVVEVPIVDLLLDSTNARLGQEQPSQQAIYIALAKQQGKRLLKLAQDIVDYGMDPTTLIAVVPTADRRKRYRVIEGNRRVLALKALETPSILASALPGPEQRRLTDLAARYSLHPIDSLACVLFESEAEVYHWVEIRHTGANDGIGLVEWDANEQDRFRARHGKGQGRRPAGQLIDFIAKIDNEDPSSYKGIVTNVDRIISTPSIRRTLGIDRVDGQMVSNFPAEEVAKGLRRIVDDLRTGTIKVKDIYHEADRLKYIGTFQQQDLPDREKALKAPVALDDLAEGRSNPAATPVKRKPRAARPKPVRTAIVPNSCRANVTPPRINAIYNELLSLNVDQYPNACGVLLRVFIELSIDHEIDASKLMSESERRSNPLKKRLKIVAEHLKSSGRINAQLEQAIKKIADSQDVIAASSVTFNQYVHNQYVYPKPSELRTAWDELQPFLEQVWR